MKTFLINLLLAVMTVFGQGDHTFISYSREDVDDDRVSTLPDKMYPSPPHYHDRPSVPDEPPLDPNLDEAWKVHDYSSNSASRIYNDEPVIMPVYVDDGVKNETQFASDSSWAGIAMPLSIIMLALK